MALITSTSNIKKLFCKTYNLCRRYASIRQFKFVSSHSSENSFDDPTRTVNEVQRTDLGIRIKFCKHDDHRFNSMDELFFDYLWLLDNCRCSRCYDNSIYQKKYTGNPASLLSSINDDDIVVEAEQPKSVTVNGPTLHISWSSNHQSMYELDWLCDNVFRQNNQHSKPAIKLWNRDILSHGDFPTMVYERAGRCGKPDGNLGRQLMRNLITYGFCFIQGVEATEEATIAVVQRFFTVQATYFGTFWSVRQDSEKEDSAYSNEYIPPHNDCTYFSESPGLMILHCLEEPMSGGESVLVDGFYGSDQLRRKDMSSYCYLASTPIESCYLDKEGNQFVHCDTVLKHHPFTHEILQVRFNPLDLLPVKTIRQEEMRTFYKSFGSLARIMWAEANRTQFSLRPGTILVFDNWRLLHSRNSFLGNRLLYGCYVSRTDFRNRARRAGLCVG